MNNIYGFFEQEVRGGGTWVGLQHSLYSEINRYIP